ncbi:MAG: putative oxidoreductase C-terminal domain-containing protein, partial [Bacteroidales bacterium]|nr:putative oxidoreductase C-terminal domain-containing protein [Bacteroidales bacterium]
IEIIAAHHWPTPILPSEFRKATGENNYPEFLNKYLKDSILQVYSNGDITYRLKGIYAKISVIWNFEAPEGAGDTHYSIMRGSLSNAIIRQGEEQNYQPRLYIEPAGTSDLSTLETNLRNHLSILSKKYPGIDLAKTEKGFEITIPDSYRIGHEGHFGQVTENFMKYLADGKLPEWEVPNMIAKYYTITKALEMAE